MLLFYDWIFVSKFGRVEILLRSWKVDKPDWGFCFMIGFMSSLKSLFIVERKRDYERLF